MLKYLKKILSTVQYASIKTFILSELTNNTNQPLSTSESLSSILATKHNTLQQDNEKKLKLSYDFSTLLTCSKHSKPVKINIGNIRKHYPNSYRTVKQQHASSNVCGNNNSNNNTNNVKDIHSLYTIIKPNHNKKTKSKHSKESKTQSNSKSTSRDKSNTNAKTNQYNIYNYNYIRHNKHLLALDNNSNSNNVNINNNNRKHFSNSDKSGCPLLNEKLFSKLNLKPYTTSNNNNTPSSIINTTSSVIKTNNNNNNSKRENTSINLNTHCNNNNIKNVHIKQVKHSKNKKANSNTSHSNSNTNRSHYHSSINSYRSNRLGKNPNMSNIHGNNVVSSINKDQRHNTSKIPHKKKLTKKKLNKSKQEHTIVINYNNERLPLMIVNKKEKERICKQIERKCEQDEMIEKIKAEYIDLSEQEEVVKKVKEEITGDNVEKGASSSKHSRDQNTKVSNKNNKNEEIMKQIKNSLDDNLKVMFNFSYENFLSKESETESKKSSEQEILITESYEA